MIPEAERALGLAVLTCALAFTQGLVAPVVALADSGEAGGMGGRTGQAAATSGDTAPEMLEVRKSRLARSTQLIFVAPYYSLQQSSRSARLVLNNRFAQPIDLELTAYDPAGQPFPLTPVTLQPKEHREVDLRQDLEDAPANFARGSVRLSFFGDEEMIQAWLKLSGTHDTLVIPLIKASSMTQGSWISFWDLQSPGDKGKGSISYYLHNAAAYPVRISVTLSVAGSPSRTYLQEIRPAGTLTIRPPAKVRGSYGVVRFSVEPSDAPVAVVGLAETHGSVTALPLESPSILRSRKSYYSVSLPFQMAGREQPPHTFKTIVTLADTRTSGAPRSIKVSILDQESGVTIRDINIVLSAGQVKSLDLTAQAPEALSEKSAPARLQITSAAGDFLPKAESLADSGEILEVALIPRDKTHESGTYPLPPLSEYNVVTSFVNLGSTKSEIVMQVDTDHGTFAPEALEIPAGGGLQVDFGELASLDEVDILGRRFDAAYRSGFLQWSARSGSRELIARTEMRKHGEADVVGFNCFGCCEEFPRGAIIPGSIDFDIGQNPIFQTVEWIDNCAGTMGPYYITPSSMGYLAPVSWDSVHVSSVDYTNQIVSFSASDDFMWIDCSFRHRRYGGSGPVVVDRCLKKHNPDFDPNPDRGGCPGQATTCSTCFDCCEKNKEVDKCRCAELLQDCSAIAAEACRACKNACALKFPIEDCTGVFSCLP